MNRHAFLTRYSERRPSEPVEAPLAPEGAPARGTLSRSDVEALRRIERRLETHPTARTIRVGVGELEALLNALARAKCRTSFLGDRIANSPTTTRGILRVRRADLAAALQLIAVAEIGFAP